MRVEYIWAIDEICATSEDSLVEQILRKRKVDPFEFLNGDLTALHDPFLMLGMRDAVGTILAHTGDKVTVYGDYDADGITSTAILCMSLAELGYQVDYYIPDRVTEGYGLNMKAIDAIYNRGTKLIITCDCGITGIKEVDYAHSLGMHVIITDHHECQEELPNAEAIVDPKRPQCIYPFKHLAGVGVAWKLATALYSSMGFGPAYSLKFLEIVCIGTVADMVDLVGENRVIVKYGMPKVERTNNLGLLALLDVLGLKDKTLTPYNIGWQIAPCINASGRIDKADKGVDLLMTPSPFVALTLAEYLEGINRERQEIQSLVTAQVIEQIMATNNDKVIVHYVPGIQEGIVGLVAGQVVRKLYKPAILLTDSEEPGILKGSGRSIDAYDMFSAVSKHKHLCTKFGGHRMACGMSIPLENLGLLASALNADATLADEDLRPRLHVDFELNPTHVSLDTVQELSALEPFGKGNSRPVFAFTNVRVQSVQVLKEEHLKLMCDVEGVSFEALGWNMAEKYKQMGSPVWVNIAFYPEANTWNGQSKLQLKLEDIISA